MAKMTDEKLATLVSRLLERTTAGKLNWEETARSHFYQVAFPEYVVQIGPTDEGIPILQLRNKDNVLMEQVSARQLYQHLTDAELQMQELYTAAMRKALNTDKALDDILSSLEDDK
jgi:hypothetical protein